MSEIVKEVVTSANPVTGIISGITSLGGQWLQGKQKIGEAKIAFKVAQFQAKAKAIETVQGRTFDLDELSVKEAAKTYWDEFLCVIYLYPFIYTVMVYPLVQAGGWVNPEVMWEAINHTPDWYKYGVALIGVRYLGFRNLLRNLIEAWRAKGGSVIQSPSKIV